MKLVRCDECHVEVPERECGGDPAVVNKVIRLAGYRNPKGDILLPNHLLTHDFCSRECFEKWIGRREGLGLVEDHKKKFAGFITALMDTRKAMSEVMFIHNPTILGDNYAEVLANLELISTSCLALRIVPPNQRKVGS